MLFILHRVSLGVGGVAAAHRITPANRSALRAAQELEGGENRKLPGGGRTNDLKIVRVANVQDDLLSR